MDKETLEMFQAVLSGIEGMEKRINAKIENEIRGVKVLIENDIGKRVDSLFDGYKLVHEKQWELERTIEKLTERIERLEARAV